MKLTLTIATALAGLIYLIVKQFNPDFPFTQEEVLRAFLFLLGVLGVVVTEAKARAALIARGYDGFK
jgi:hypothetical protein